jgi:hypothetical protein
MHMHRVLQGVCTRAADGIVDGVPHVVVLYLVRFVCCCSSPGEKFKKLCVRRLTIFQLSPQSSSSSVCIVPLNGYQSLSASALMPIVCAGLLAATFGLQLAWKRLRPGAGGQQTPVSTVVLSTPYFRTLIAILITTYTNVTKSCLLYLQCVDAGSRSVVFLVSTPGLGHVALCVLCFPALIPWIVFQGTHD